MYKSIADQLVELAAQLESRAGEIAKEQALNIKSAEGAHKEARVAWAELDKRNAEIRRLQCELDAAVEHCESKSREIADLRAKLDKADGWIEWHGGACPVEKTAQVYVRLRGYETDPSGPFCAGFWEWNHKGEVGDIIAYRLAEPAADPERPKTWRLLLDTLKRQNEQLKRKDTIILAAHQQRDHYRQLAENAEQIHRDDLRLIAELRRSSDSWRRTADKLSAQLAHEKALSAARGKEIERLRAPRKMVISQGRITWYDENGEVQSAAEGDGVTMFDLLGR